MSNLLKKALVASLESKFDSGLDSLQWRYVKPGAEIDLLNELEAEIQRRLPSQVPMTLPLSLVGLLMLRNNGRPSRATFQRKYTIGTLLPVLRNAKTPNVLDVYKWYQKDRLEQLNATREGAAAHEVPFAISHTGDLFVYTINDGNGATISYWDHERADLVMLIDGDGDLISQFFGMLR